MYIKAKRNIHTAVYLPEYGLFQVDKNEVKKISNKIGSILLLKWPNYFEEVLKVNRSYSSKVKENLNFKSTSAFTVEDTKFI